MSLLLRPQWDPEQVTQKEISMTQKSNKAMDSSNFPLWDRNLNTGEDSNRSSAMQIAHQRILHDHAHLSRLLLPIIPA